MRLRFITSLFLAAILLSACDFWPKDLEPLAESIGRQVSGETTAWLVSGDSIVINVANSPSYRMPQSELEAQATGIAEQAIGYSEAPLEAVVITYYEGEVSDDLEKMREFIFLVMENRPVLQPNLDLDATGPLTVDEIQAAMDRLDESYDSLGKSLAGEHRECVVEEVEKRARDAGDPDTLDPASVEFLTPETWNALDSFGKRLILTQAITTKALFACVSPERAK
ncbi:MAG: hypothetical protein KJO33_01530 [Gammaproteobacteria bacterium]|nr:hypothetical protein [Gammaproteobacteria bacterium]